jgi:hypothetical protein
MKTTRFFLAALVVAGLAGTMPAASAKKHHKSGSMNSMSVKKGSTSSGAAANPSSEGNVGPGTNNNNGPVPGGR